MLGGRLAQDAIVIVIEEFPAAVREDIMSRQSIISTMVSGERMFKDNRPD